MSWVRIDDEFYQHPKIVQAGPLALAWHIAGLCYCSRYLTDGEIPLGIVPTLVNPTGIQVTDWDGELCGASHDATYEDAVERLVRFGLWEEIPSGYRIHDYLKYNPSRADVLAQRSKRQAAGQAGGKARAQANAKHGAKQTLSDSAGKNVAKLNPVPVPDPVPQEEFTHTHTRARDQADAQANAKRMLDEKSGVVARETSHTLEAALLADNPSLSSSAIADATATLLAASTGKRWPADGWLRDLTWIAGQPHAELDRVLAAITADTWCQANPSQITPAHLRKYWPRYADGPRHSVIVRGPARADRFDPATEDEDSFEGSPEEALARDRARTAAVAAGRRA